MNSISESVTSVEDAASRSGTYRLLARIWLYEVDENVLRNLRKPPLGDAWLQAGGHLPVDDHQQTIEELAISYCKLLVGPKDHLPPYQSVWRTGLLQGEAIESMRQAVDVVGYDQSCLPRGIILDHLGVQLDVMGHILEEISTWQAEQKGLEQVWEVAHSFFSAHLSWADDLLKAAEQRANHEFYRSCALLTRDFLHSETVEFSNGSKFVN